MAFDRQSSLSSRLLDCKLSRPTLLPWVAVCPSRLNGANARVAVAVVADDGVAPVDGGTTRTMFACA